MRSGDALLGARWFPVFRPLVAAFGTVAERGQGRFPAGQAGEMAVSLVATQAALSPVPAKRASAAVVALGRLLVLLAARSAVEVTPEGDHGNGAGACQLERGSSALGTAARCPLIIDDHDRLAAQPPGDEETIVVCFARVAGIPGGWGRGDWRTGRRSA